MAIVVADAQTAPAVDVLRSLPGHARAARIGAVTTRGTAAVVAHHPAGGQRVLRMLSGEQLPRIC